VQGQPFTFLLTRARRESDYAAADGVPFLAISIEGPLIFHRLARNQFATAVEIFRVNENVAFARAFNEAIATLI